MCVGGGGGGGEGGGGGGQGGLGFKNEICLKIFSRTARLRCLKIGFG